jgi:hypothetical protein
MPGGPIEFEPPPELGGVAGGGGMPMPPPAPPPLKMKRVGTGVPDAFEIAEYQQRLDLEKQRQAFEMPLRLAQQYLSPEDARRATLGRFGAPESQRSLQAISGWGVSSSEDRCSLSSSISGGGAPARRFTSRREMVKMSGSTGGVPRRVKVEDPNSSTGGFRVPGHGHESGLSA